MVDKTDGVEKPCLLIYDMMQFEGSSDMMFCDHQRRLLCVEKELIQPREEAVSFGVEIHIEAMLTLKHCLYFSIDS